MTDKPNFGLTGLAVMGQNLARNVAHKGFPIAVHNRTTEKTDKFMEEHGGEGALVGSKDVQSFVDALQSPRAIMIMVKAGQPVDDVIAELKPLLNKGDLLIDGGNSLFSDTERRVKELTADGFLFLGTGVSGGEEGALNGPSIMPGGSEEAYKIVEPIFTKIAAQVDGTPCCTFIGEGGAGHYVKMVHNGIEYADMQLIAEAYDLLKNGLGLTNDELHQVFTQWNEGDLDSFLIEITAQIFARKDDQEGGDGYLVDHVLDKAAQKGTGKWTVQSALDLGTPVTAITEAVFARSLSAIKDQRVAASKVLPGPTSVRHGGDREAFINDIRDALYASKVVAYAQGFEQMLAAAKEHGWTLHPGEIATIWRGGCIIRARFLDRIKDAYDQQPDLANLLLAPYFTDAVKNGQDGWRRVVGEAARLGIPIPAFSSALAYYDGYRRERLPANLIQAQRDLFGAHTYERTDKPGAFHSQWVEEKQEPKNEAQHGVQTTAETHGDIQMIFSKRGAFYQVSRVTGPMHNFLALELTTGPQEVEPQIEARPDFCSGHGELDLKAIISAVLEGLALANDSLNTMYAVTRIYYHMGDNPPEEIYGVLAFKIIERLVSGGEFSTEEAKDG